MAAPCTPINPLCLMLPADPPGADIPGPPDLVIDGRTSAQRAQRAHIRRRRWTLAGLATIGATLALGAVAGRTLVAHPLNTPCPTEDSRSCYWRADVMGDGSGRSFVDIDGHLVTVPHWLLSAEHASSSPIDGADR